MASCHTHAACYGIFYSPTEYAEFTEPPTEMSSHGFLLRRVWHLAIPTPLAMGYSPTEHAEFTEPSTEMSSHGFHRFTQILRVRCSPTEYAEFTEPPTEMSSHGFHRFTQILRVRCSPTEFTEYTEFGSVGMAGMPYPPTSVRIRVICGRLFSARGSVSSVLICGRLFSARSFCEFRAFCGNLFSPTEFTESTEFGSVGMAGMPYPPTSVLICAICGSPFSVRGSVYSVYSVGASSPLVRLVQLRLLHPLGWQRGYGRDAIPSYICAHPCHLWEALLCQRFCVFGVFRGSFFTACSVGAAETAAPPGGIHRSSVHISPPHHLTTTTSFHLEPCLLHVLPVLWVRLRHHLRLVDAQPGEHDCRRCERHRHAVVVVRIDRL